VSAAVLGSQKGLNVKMQNAGIKGIPAGAERWCSKCSV
jgi:hypothetical protein